MSSIRPIVAPTSATALGAGGEPDTLDAWVVPLDTRAAASTRLTRQCDASPLMSSRRRLDEHDAPAKNGPAVSRGARMIERPDTDAAGQA